MSKPVTLCRPPSQVIMNREQFSSWCSKKSMINNITAIKSNLNLNQMKTPLYQVSTVLESYTGDTPQSSQREKMTFKSSSLGI